MPWPEPRETLAPLVTWFDGAKRRLPWRAEDLAAPHPRPYAVLVSELMLQQTQVATVIPYFERWMERFSDPAALAEASSDELHKAWEGLGYYRRARYLQAAAAIIARQGWPTDLEGLQALPGLGPYTAAALASIAFQLPEPALDGNAFRVLARLLGVEGDPTREANAFRAWLRPALQTLGPSRLTQAVMELGALVCSPAPKCADCPLSAACAARRMQATDRIPARKPRPKPTEQHLWLLAIRAEGRWLLRPPGGRGLLAGLWSWPVLPLVAPVDETVAESAWPYGLLAWAEWPGWTQLYTHRKEHIRPLLLDCAKPFESPGLQWVPDAELSGLPFGKRDRMLLDLHATPPYSKEAPPLAELLELLQNRT